MDGAAGITRQGEQEGAVILGSCTVCLAVLKPGGLLEVANVGDSGFRIIRGNEMVFASEVMLSPPLQCLVCKT